MNQTENIHIRPVNEKDAAFLSSLMNCPSVLQVLNEVPSELRDWMGAIKEWLNDDDEEDFIVVHRNISIGWLGVNGLLNEDRKAYLKMAVLLTDHQGLGFGTWAIQELMCYLGLTEKANAHQKKRRKQEKMGENSTILPRDVVQ